MKKSRFGGKTMSLKHLRGKCPEEVGFMNLELKEEILELNIFL